MSSNINSLGQMEEESINDYQSIYHRLDAIDDPVGQFIYDSYIDESFGNYEENCTKCKEFGSSDSSKCHELLNCIRDLFCNDKIHCKELKQRIIRALCENGNYFLIEEDEENRWIYVLSDIVKLLCYFYVDDDGMYYWNNTEMSYEPCEDDETKSQCDLSEMNLYIINDICKIASPVITNYYKAIDNASKVIGNSSRTSYPEAKRLNVKRSISSS